MLVYHEHNALWSGQFIGGRKTQGKSHCGSPDALKAKPEVLHLTPVTSKRRPWAVAQIRCILVIDLPVVWNYIFILFVPWSRIIMDWQPSRIVIRHQFGEGLHPAVDWQWLVMVNVHTNLCWKKWVVTGMHVEMLNCLPHRNLVTHALWWHVAAISATTILGRRWPFKR